eukprot:5795872-Lingulodinium_polyedra.AAC.1
MTLAIAFCHGADQAPLEFTQCPWIASMHWLRPTAPGGVAFSISPNNALTTTRVRDPIEFA